MSGRSKAAGHNPASFFCQVVNLRVIFLLMRNLLNVEGLFSLGRLPNLAGIDVVFGRFGHLTSLQSARLRHKTSVLGDLRSPSVPMQIDNPLEIDRIV